MTSFKPTFCFSTLLPAIQDNAMLQQLHTLTNDIDKNDLGLSEWAQDKYFKKWRSEWQKLPALNAEDSQQTADEYERVATDWLMQLFNTVFADQNVILARSAGEPEYFPATDSQPARIEFAHGFFQSALHECSHWCIAGQARRQRSDFGYWYAPDGRTEAQQQAFERVEIKPQALECLFTLACARPFQVSQDNLFADFDTSGSTFASDVYLQAQAYISKPNTLPHDAQLLLNTLLRVCSTKHLG